MPRDLYDCTAAELATHSVKHLQHDTPPSDAATWLTENGYDATPVYADDDPTGFIHKDDVTTDDDGNTLDDHLTPLTIDYMISGDTSFTAVLSALIENPSTSSVVPTTSPASSPAPTSTPPPVRIYLFDRITYLEEHLRELILDTKPDWKNTPVTADELDDIKDRYEDAQAANVALDELHYVQFSTLETIVTNVEACWKTCGFATKGGAYPVSTRLPNFETMSRTLTSSSKTRTVMSSSATVARPKTCTILSKLSVMFSQTSKRQSMIPVRPLLARSVTLNRSQKITLPSVGSARSRMWNVTSHDSSNTPTRH